MPRERVLVVDGDEASREALIEGLRDAGFSAEGANTGPVAVGCLREKSRFDAVVLDHDLPDAGGLHVLQQTRGVTPKIAVVIMTASSSVETAVRAMKLGAAELATKPVRVDQVIRMLRTVLDRAANTSAPIACSSGASVPALIGNSDVMMRLRSLLERVASSPISTVLLTGESGTGKDVAARIIHHGGARARRSFVNIRCSALPENLLESELFGHEAGSFTSATSPKKGLLELADGGTVFLDEIAEMTPGLQARLLRFIDERAFRRVGGTEDIRVDARIVAATNRNLPAEVASGRFRDDLYYRLRVVSIHLPPLRERPGDIEALADHFIPEFNRLFGKRVVGLDPAAADALRRHSFPGNVRELKHTIEHGTLLAEGSHLTVADCGVIEPSSGVPVLRLPREGLVLEQLERDLVLQALDATGWNQVQAGKLLGLNRDQIRYRIEKFGLSRERPLRDDLAS